MPKLSPEEQMRKWAQRTSAATADFQAGVQRVTRSPGQAAVENAQGYLNGVQSGFDKWKRNTSALSLESWKEKTAGIGAQRVAAGVEAKKDKYLAYAADVAPYMDRGQQKVSAMPKSTFEERVQRSVAWQRHMHDYRRRG